MAAANDADCSDAKCKRRKKKRKKTESVKRRQQQNDVECGESADEIERCIWKVNQLLGEPLPGCSNQASELQLVNAKSKENILTVQHKHLNPYNELKRIFGSKTVQAEQRYNCVHYIMDYIAHVFIYISVACTSVTRCFINKRKLYVRSKRKTRGRSGHLKKTWLICPRDNWPPIGKSGLSMSLDNSMENTGTVQYFIYEHSTSYKQIQLKFLQAVESLNPENIIVSI